MALFERADSGRKVTWFSILGLVLVPIIIAAGFVFATWKASDRLDHVKAAVVNNDDGAKIDGKQVPMGRQLAAGLVDSDEDENYDWVLSDDDDARQGIKDGEYVAVVTIPKGFSKAIATTANDEPAKAAQATISVTSSKVSPLSDAAISNAIASAARDKFNTEYAKQYLNGIYVGFNKMGDQFDQLSDGANKLDDGAKGLEEGTSGLSKGVGELDSGVSELDRNGGKIAAGADQLAGGADQLQGGADQLAGGAHKLSGGLDKLHSSTKDLPTQAGQLSKGADDLSDGVNKYTKGTDEMVKQMAAAGGGDTSRLDELVKGANGVAEGSRGVSDGIDDYQKGLQQQSSAASNATTVDQLAGKNGPLTQQQAAQIKAQLCPTGTPPQACQGLQQAYLAGMSAGLDGAVKGLQQKDPKTGQTLGQGAEQTADGAERTAEGVEQTAEQVKEAAEGSKKIADQKDQLLGASKQLRGGASQLADGTDKFAAGMKPLAKGIGDAADGADQYAQGADKYAQGVHKYNTGAQEYAAGVGQYTGGVHKLAGGTGQLVEGANQLDDGTQKYSQGVGKFADGLEKGKDDVPSYSKSERSKMSKAVASPIKDNLDSLKDVSLASSIALLLIMALWIGALITYMVVRAVSATALTSRKRSAAIMARGLVPGLIISVVQAAVMTALAQLILDLSATDLFTLLGFTAFAGVVFTVINYALVAWWGGVGRFIGVIFVVVAIAAKVLSAVPGWLSGAASFMPLTPAMDGITGIATGAGGVGHAFGSLLLWLIVAGAASIAAVARKRSVGPAALQKLTTA